MGIQCFRNTVDEPRSGKVKKNAKGKNLKKIKKISEFFTQNFRWMPWIHLVVEKYSVLSETTNKHLKNSDVSQLCVFFFNFFLLERDGKMRGKNVSILRDR